MNGIKTYIKNEYHIYNKIFKKNFNIISNIFLYYQKGSLDNSVRKYILIYAEN